jgi:phage/plasmid-associated DNA primase
MSRLAQIADTDLDALLYDIRTATKIYDKRDFNKKVVGKAEQKMLKLVQAVAVKERQDIEDEDRYTLPSGITIEQHLFNLTFCDKERPIKVIDHAFRQYDPEYGYWASIPDEELEQRVLQNAELSHYPPTKTGPGRSLATAANVEKAMKFAGKKLFASTHKTNSKHLIAFRNFTVCTKTGDTRDHNPDYHITTCLPYDYAPGAGCPPAMLGYIASSFGESQVEYVRAAIGLILDLTAPDRFIHLTGSSGSGKGVFTRLIMKFFGSESVGSPNNFKIFANPDQVHQYLSGKRLLAIDDIVGFIGEEIGRFYTAVERTAMNARCLFQPKGYTQQFDCRYTVASVGQLSAKYSNSKGWERRVFPLPTVRASRQEEDERLELELENCIADIVSWALGQDKALRNDILRHPAKYNPAAAEYFRDAAFSSSSAWAFIDECLEPRIPSVTDAFDDQGVNETELYLAYKAYTAAVGKPPMSRDGFVHELRQVLPLNWVDRRSGGKVKRRFVYIRLRPAFEFGEFGATCNMEARGYDGVLQFREWSASYGAMHPYDPSDLEAMANPPQPPPSEPCAGHAGQTPPVSSAEAVCVSEKIPPHTQPNNLNEGLHGLHTPHSTDPEPVNPSQGCFDGDGQVVTPWLTPGKPTWWTDFEQRLIESTTWEQLQQAKTKTSASRRTQIMNTWDSDGRYEWLKGKADRLETESANTTQGSLG